MGQVDKERAAARRAATAAKDQKPVPPKQKPPKGPAAGDAQVDDEDVLFE